VWALLCCVLTEIGLALCVREPCDSNRSVRTLLRIDRALVACFEQSTRVENIYGTISSAAKLDSRVEILCRSVDISECSENNNDLVSHYCFGKSLLFSLHSGIIIVSAVKTIMIFRMFICQPITMWGRNGFVSLKKLSWRRRKTHGSWRSVSVLNNACFLFCVCSGAEPNGVRPNLILHRRR
jgi:hypothetical protein